MPMRNTGSALLSLLVIYVLSVWSAPAGAVPLVLDDFESGPFQLVDTTTGDGAATAEQSGLPPESALGGVRFASTILFSGSAISVGVEDGLATLDRSESFGPSFFHYDGVADGVAAGTGGSLFLDLTTLGDSGGPAFRIEVTEVGGDFGGVNVTVFDSDSQATNSTTAYAPGVYQVGFGGLGYPSIDFSDLRAIQLNFAADTTLSVGRVIVIPEPGIVLMMGLGLAGLATIRR